MREAKSLSRLISPLVKSACRRLPLSQVRIILEWSQIVGPTWASICTPERLHFPSRETQRQGILYLKIKSCHATQIAYGQSQILERINQFYGYPAVERLLLKHI